MQHTGTQINAGTRAMDPERHHSDNFVTASYRIHAWWLKTFRGYRMESMHRVPKQNLFGEIYYKNHWVLSKKPEAD